MATCDSSSEVGVVLPKAIRSSIGQICPGLLATTLAAMPLSRRLPKRASLRPSICWSNAPARENVRPRITMTLRGNAIEVHIAVLLAFGAPGGHPDACGKKGVDHGGATQLGSAGIDATGGVRCGI